MQGDSIPVEDRGLSYGDGLFETIAVREGRCRFLTAHLARLAAGCERLGIPVPDNRQIAAELGQLLGTTEYGTAKIIVTRGHGPRGYRQPVPCNPTRLVGMQRASPAIPPADGVRVRYCATLISRNPKLAGLKTLNRLEQVLARAEWTDNEIAEGLMLNDRGEVVCGTMSNLFYTQAGVLLTPELHECGVSGIMRQATIEAAQRLGIEVQERKVNQQDLQNAEDVFLSNALIGIWPVAELAGQEYRCSEVTNQIMRGLYAMGVIECGT